LLGWKSTKVVLWELQPLSGLVSCQLMPGTDLFLLNVHITMVIFVYCCYLLFYDRLRTCRTAKVFSGLHPVLC